MRKGEVLYVFQSHAAFRRRMAEEKDRPWDLHNTRYAESLERVIAYIESLADDAPAFQKLDGYTLSDDEARIIVHCGPHYAALTEDEAAVRFEDWVDEVVSGPDNAARMNSYERGKAAGAAWATTATTEQVKELSDKCEIRSFDDKDFVPSDIADDKTNDEDFVEGWLAGALDWSDDCWYEMLT